MNRSQVAIDNAHKTERRCTWVKESQMAKDTAQVTQHSEQLHR